MNYNFDIHQIKYETIGRLVFELNNIKYNFKFNIYTPDTDDSINNINAHYFSLSIINEYGAKLKYTEYVNCFDVLASKIYNDKYLSFFNVNIKNEFNDTKKEELKKLFLSINAEIIKKIKEYYRL